MNVRVKETADETRQRIATVAEELFRRMGFAKTAVADIAAELGMSPANVYRFFPSKNAIVETICQRCLAEIDGKVTEIVAGPGTPQQKITDIFLSILRYHKDNFLAERRLHDMVLVAIEHNWDNIEAHKARICAAMAEVLRQGEAAGVFEPHDSEAVSWILLGMNVRFCHPILIAQEIDQDLETQLRASTMFALRSIEKRRTPFPGIV